MTNGNKNRTRIMLVFGTRPEAIKMCPVVTELQNRPESFDVSVCVTGQHEEMLGQVLGAFGIVPDYNLKIMKPSQTLSDITMSTLSAFNPVLEKERPDIVLVHGDTTTSFASALSCFYHGIAIGHVEAGLRTHNLRSPWPEEFNRQAVDLIAEYFFAPTERAKSNLLQEGKPAEKIFVTGNTGIDALRTTIQRNYRNPLLEWVGESRLILVTAHRRENLGKPMHGMFRAIRGVMERYPDTKAIYPIHMNPLVREAAHDELDGFERIKLIEPLDVVTFHNLMAASYLVLTDSGGIQEEAPNLGKPVLVMRDTTERPEGVEAGTLKLVGTDENGITVEFDRLLKSSEAYEAMSRASNPYGDGYASRRIADVLAGGIA